MPFWDAEKRTQTIKIQTNNISLSTIGHFFFAFGSFPLSSRLLSTFRSKKWIVLRQMWAASQWSHITISSTATIRSSRFSFQAVEPNFSVSFAVQICVSSLHYFFFSLFDFSPSLFSSLFFFLFALPAHSLVSIYNGSFLPQLKLLLMDCGEEKRTAAAAKEKLKWINCCCNKFFSFRFLSGIALKTPHHS